MELCLPECVCGCSVLLIVCLYIRLKIKKPLFHLNLEEQEVENYFSSFEALLSRSA